MAGKKSYRVGPRKSYQFFKMNQDQKQVLKQAMSRSQAIAELREATGEEDAQLLKVLLDIGLDADSLNLLPLVPLVEVAWADGEVQPREEKLLVQLAEARGMVEGSVGRGILDRWLGRRPDDPVFEACDQVFHTMLEHMSEHRREQTLSDLELSIHAVAAASGGLFGFFGAISEEEEQIMSHLTDLFHQA